MSKGPQKESSFNPRSNRYLEEPEEPFTNEMGRKETSYLRSPKTRGGEKIKAVDKNSLT